MSEAKFRKEYPKASIERQVTNSGKTYYLVRKTLTSHWYAGSGDTKRAAWADAWSRHLAVKP